MWGISKDFSVIYLSTSSAIAVTDSHKGNSKIDPLRRSISQKKTSIFDEDMGGENVEVTWSHQVPIRINETWVIMG